jgi:hypothetical protein
VFKSWDYQQRVTAQLGKSDGALAVDFMGKVLATLGTSDVFEIQVQT